MPKFGLSPGEFKMYTSEVERIYNKCVEAQKTSKVVTNVVQKVWVDEGVKIYNSERKAGERKIYAYYVDGINVELTTKKPFSNSFRSLVIDRINLMGDDDTVVIRNEFELPDFVTYVRQICSSWGKEVGREYSVKFWNGEALVTIKGRQLKPTPIGTLNELVRLLNEGFSSDPEKLERIRKLAVQVCADVEYYIQSKQEEQRKEEYVDNII